MKFRFSRKLTIGVVGRVVDNAIGGNIRRYIIFETTIACEARQRDLQWKIKASVGQNRVALVDDIIVENAAVIYDGTGNRRCREKRSIRVEAENLCTTNRISCCTISTEHGIDGGLARRIRAKANGSLRQRG